MIAAVAPWSFAGSAQAAGSIPANFFTVADTGGANDAVGQGDLTQMGRDDTDATQYKLFWSWDNIVWPGNNTGDACALFDTNGNTFIDYAVCVEIGAGPGGTVVQTAISPSTWTCNDSKNDRCAGPASVTNHSSVGTLSTFAASPPADLITDTDPFPTGTDSPNDSTAQVRIPKAFLPAGAELVNVCSYPSIGNGGNTDPKDCVANPGGGFLVIHKDDGINSSTVFPFTINPGNISTSVTGTGNAPSQSLVVGSGYSFSESVPGGWNFVSASCTKEGGGATGTASGTGVTGITIESGKITTCNVVDTEQHPALSITKAADTGAANPLSYDHVGQVVTYTLTATNTGNVTLTSASISDPLFGGTVTSPCKKNGVSILAANIPTTLAPGDVLECKPTYTITQADLDNGQKNNTATAHGTPPSGPALAPTANATITAAQSSSLSITKTADTGAANPLSYDHVGQVVTYTLTATNTGNVTLTSASISDPLFGGTVTSPCKKNGVSILAANIPTTLAPGDVLECKPTYTIIQADLDNGHKDNTATAHGTPPSGPALAPTANASITAAGAPNYTITKSADTGGAVKTVYDHVGQDVTYTITLTNTGNQTLSSVSISDPMFAALNCVPAQPVATLAVGSSLVCTAHHLITQADLDAGSITNTATGHASGPAGALGDKTAQATVTGAQTKSIGITKTPKPTTYSKVGDVIDYTIVATNTGNVTLTNVTVTDPKVSNLSCNPAVPVASLAPGDHIDCTASHTITQADMDAGSFDNTATASATGVNPVQAPASVTTTQTPQIGLTKTPSTNSYDHVGQVVNYTLVATNTGNVTLTNVDVTDPKVSNLQCTPATPVASLAPGDHVDCTATYTITQADLNAGSFTNTGHTVGTPPTGPNVTANAPATIGAVQNPGLSVTKVANPTSFSGVGQTITYTVTATNTGNVTLSAFGITDPLVGGLMTSCTDGGAGVLNPPLASFAPGAVMVCTAQYVTTQADVNAGKVANTATAAGLDPNRQPVSNSASATVGFIAPPPPPGAPILSVTKTSVPASGSFVQPGDQVVYTLGYSNTGGSAATTVVISDTLPADLDYVAGTASNGGTYDAATRTLTWSIGNVAVGATGTVTFTAQVAQSATNGEVLSNVAVLTAPGVSVVSQPDDVTVTVPTGDLTITKAVNKSEAEFGDTLTYSMNVGATGDIDQTNVVVTDSVPDKTTYVDGSASCDAPCTASESNGVVTWNIGTLAKGTSTVVTFKVTVDTPASAANGAIPAETIRNIAEVFSDADPGTFSNPVKTNITAVLGEKVHRHLPKPEPSPLPFTGLDVIRLLMIAAGAIGAGTLLVQRARSRRAVTIAVKPPTEE